jgi:hypothetical protein
MRWLAYSARDFRMRPRLAVFALLLSACGGEPGTTSAPAATWSVDSVPTLAIGADDGDHLEAGFERLTGATRLPDGSVLAGDLGSAPLRIFGTDGKLVRTVAREGKGPGEITYLARLFRCGDAIISYDINGRRLIRWAFDGTLVREFRFAVPEGQQIPYTSACNATGRFAHVGWGARTELKAGYHRDTVAVWRADSADAPPTLFDSVPSSERWGQTYEGRVVGTRPLPFAKQPLIGVSSDRIYIATGDADGVRAYGLDGARLPNIPMATAPMPVTPADIRDLTEREVLEEGESARGYVERELGSITFPETKSATSQLIVDAEGLLWLRPSVAAGATRAEWQVMNAAGQLLATLSLPAALEIFEIGDDYILGREVDLVAGVPLLKSYRLRRAEP